MQVQMTWCTRSDIDKQPQIAKSMNCNISMLLHHGITPHLIIDKDEAAAIIFVIVNSNSSNESKQHNQLLQSTVTFAVMLVNVSASAAEKRRHQIPRNSSVIHVK